MTKYGIIVILRDILAYNFAKYQYFKMRPGLFDCYQQIPYSAIISSISCKMSMFCPKKPSKKHRNAIFLNTRFNGSQKEITQLLKDPDFWIGPPKILTGISAKTLAKILPKIFVGLTRKSGSFSICGIFFCNP